MSDEEADKAWGLRTDRRFVILFIGYLTLFFVLVQEPLKLFNWLNPLTAFFAYKFWGIFSIPVFRSGAFLTMYDFPMEITHECTALHYLAIYVAGVLPYRAHSPRYRFAGILIGTAVIMSLNVIRIGVLGMVGHYAMSVFDLVHAYLWQGTYTVIVFAMWLLWVDDKIRMTKRGVFSGALALIACLLTLGAMHACLEHYAAFLAASADLVLRGIGSFSGVSVSLSVEGKVILFRTAWATLHNDCDYDVMNTAVLAALAAGSFLYLKTPVLARRAMLSGTLLGLQHLLFIVLYGLVFGRGTNLDSFVAFLWLARGFGMVSPVLIWLVVSMLISKHENPITHGDIPASS